MAEPVGSLRAELSAGHAQFDSDMRKARKSVETNAKGMSAAMDKAKKSFDGNVSSLISLRGKAIAAAAAIGSIALAAKSFGSAAMRYETLGAVMEAVGKNAGYTGAQMEEFQKRLEKTGISMIQSRNAVIKMTQANLDLEKSTELARVAQDAAVIGNVNSSEAFESLIHGIQSAKTEVLRMIGINVNFEDSYKRVAKQTGRTTAQLSEAEKAQIRMNAVLDAGSGIAGTYEASMGTAGKQLGSLERHLENLKVMAGRAITPALAEIVEALTSSITDLNNELSGDGKETIEKWGINFRLAIISIRAEILRLGMLLDKIGGTMTSAQMLLYGPGNALGFKSSKERFERAADSNMMYEQRYKDKEKQLLELAKKYNALEFSGTPAGRAAAKSRTDAQAYISGRIGPPDTTAEDEKAAKEAENRLKRGQELVLSLERERDLIRAVTREEEVRWDLSKGQNKDLSESHKQKILAIAKELDALDAAVRAEEERKAVLKSIDEEIAALQKEADTFGMSETAIRLYEMSLKDATDEQKESVEVLMKDLEIKKQVAQVLEDIKTPLDDYAEKMRILNDLLAMGEINQGQYAAAAEKARKVMEDSAKDQKGILDDLKKAIEGWGQDSADALVEFGLSGKKSFSDFADSVIKDILRMIVYQTMMQPLMSGISGAMSGFFGGGRGGAAAVAVAKGGVFSHGNITPFARGGIVSRPSIFPMARGMGLMGEAGPEAVMPLTRLPGGDLGVKSAGGGGNIKINIINNNGSDVSTQQSETSQGLQLDVMIDKAVAKKMGQAGSSSNRVLKQTFGAREGLIQR